MTVTKIDAHQPQGMPSPAGVHESAAWLRDGRPDWEAIPFEVTCRKCGYDLRMLVESRCPECGLEFDWHHLLERIAQRRQWLFEHHWRQNPLSAWWRTVWRSMRPRRFWAEVSAGKEVRTRPLWCLLPLACLAGLVVRAGLGGILCAILFGISRIVYGSRVTPIRMTPTGPVWIPPDWFYSTGGTLKAQTYEALHPWQWLGYLVWMALLVGALVVLMRCLRRLFRGNSIPTGQVLRVVAYSATPVCIVWALLPVLYVVIGEAAGKVAPNLGTALVFAYSLSFLVPPITYVRAGLHHHLHVRHAWAVAAVACVAAGSLMVPGIWLLAAMLTA